MRLSPAALQQARAILAARRQTVHVGNPHWDKCPARRRADLDDQPGGYDAYEYLPDAQEGAHQEHNEKADVNWHRTRPQWQSQRLALTQRHDAIREAAKQAVLASVQANIDNVMHTAACCNIKQHFSRQQDYQGGQPQQGGSQEQEQWELQHISEVPAPAAAAAVRSQDRALRYVSLAVTDGEVQLHSLLQLLGGVERDARGCGMRPGPHHAAADHLCRPALLLPPFDRSAMAFCSAPNKTCDRPVDDRSFLLAY